MPPIHKSRGLSIADHWSSIHRPIIGKVPTKISNVSSQIIKHQPDTRHGRALAFAINPDLAGAFAFRSSAFAILCRRQKSPRRTAMFVQNNIALLSHTAGVHVPRPMAVKLALSRYNCDRALFPRTRFALRRSRSPRLLCLDLCRKHGRGSVRRKTVLDQLSSVVRLHMRTMHGEQRANELYYLFLFSRKTSACYWRAISARDRTHVGPTRRFSAIATSTRCTNARECSQPRVSPRF